MRAAFFCVAAFFCSAAWAQPSPSPVPSLPLLWGAVKKPLVARAEAIGGYSAGCLIGAARLPERGDGFRVQRPERNRTWGHPSLVAFVRELGARVRKLRLPLLAVGDLGQPRGGPAPSGHASHQSGLDADMAFPSLPAHLARVLKLAAGDPRVDRIFVNPTIKRALCKLRGNRAWLRKIRPWWGHTEHFHVRLACPAQNPACVAQPALPDGDGCGELSWWFNAEAQADREKAHGDYSAKVGRGAMLPARCQEILEQK